MPIVFAFALAGSLALHAVALFGTDVSLFGGGSEPPGLQAEIQPPPAANPAPQAAPLVKPVTKPAKSQTLATHKTVPLADTETTTGPVQKNERDMPSTASVAVSVPAEPMLPARGMIRFVILKESLSLQVGRAEHHWEFAGDGSYRLSGITETSGLAALLKPLRLEVESRGQMVAGGLQPVTFRSLKNGKETQENADFDWSTATVRLARDGSEREIAAGTQDILSLNYQLAYLGTLAEGTRIGVVTGKKYERYALDSLGEEAIETPAGRFRTLHLRAMTDTTTEIWIALDHHRLPVKIRFTDKKGESFEQVATDIGTP